jgi:Tol biopolymer transport system component
MRRTLIRKRSSQLLNLAFFSLLLAASSALAACGTLEVGLEPGASADEMSAPLAKPASDTGASGIIQHMMTPTPTPKPLQIAFIKERNVWLWTTESGTAVPLTTSGRASDGSVSISDDGEFIAFNSSNELWTVRTDGTGERKLVSLEEIDQFEPVDPGVWLYDYDWVPGTHLLAFNTHLRQSYGHTLTGDLHLVDVETLQQTTLLPPGEGGDFTYSPDGSQIAIVTAGTITLIKSDGSNRRDNVLTYAAGRTPAEDRFHAKPVWAADGSFLRVAILPADLQARPAQNTTIFHIPTDGTPGTLLSSISANFDQAVHFSSDLRYAAYLRAAEEPWAGLENSDLLITDLETGETTVHALPASRITGWSPYAQHVATLTFTAAGDQSIEAHIRQPGGDSVPIEIDEGMWILEIRWIDAHRYLLQAINLADGSWNLLEGAIGQPSALLVSIPQGTAAEDLPPFDFTH